MRHRNRCWITLAAACPVLLLSAQTPAPPFKPNAQIGVPARVGSIVTISGSNETLEHGLLREVTIHSAELALTFPNRVENVVATVQEKLLIIRASLRNPEKKSTFHIGPSAAIGFRLAQRYTGTGKFQFVMHFDPDTLKHLQKDLKGGDSGSLVGVWRIPADFRDFRLGITSDRPNLIAWYDLNSAIGKLRDPLFAAPDGINVKPSATVPPGSAAFEIDGLEIRPGGLTMPNHIAGAPVDPNKPAHVVTLTVTNRLLMPARWGWQYLNVELIGANGTATKAYPAIIDRATDKDWAGDLAPGASVTSQFLFYPGTGNAAGRTVRLTLLATGRQVEFGL
jgi:hypothetical protein